MKNYIQPGKVITLTNPAAISSGVGYMTGNLFGVAAADYAADEAGEYETEGVFDLAKDDAAFSVGDPVYWDDQNSKCTDSSHTAGLTRIGACTKAAVAGDSTVRARLDGFVTRQSPL